MKAAFYGRVSTEDQRERQTIQTQREFAERYFELHGIECSDWFLDAGVSGMKPLPDRPEGARLLHEAGNGRRWDTLFVYRLDRLGRDPRDTLNSVDALEKLGVRLRSMTEPFDTSDPTGRCLLTMLSAFARLERDSIVARSKAGSERVAREGRWLGGDPPFGYQISRSDGVPRLVVSDEPIPGFTFSEAEVIRMIYRLLVEERWNTRQIADHLTALGVPTRRQDDGRIHHLSGRAPAGKWVDRTIRKMVHHSVYRGVWVYGKNRGKTEPIEVPCPAIVDEATWERASQQLRSNEGYVNHPGNREYLLRGLAHCEYCGLVYAGHTVKKQSRDYGYYICKGKDRFNGDLGTVCRSRSLPVSLEEAIWGDVEAFLRNPADLLEELLSDASQEAQIQRLEKERAAAARAVAEKEGERSRILALYRKGRIDDETLERQLADIEAEERASRAVLTELSQHLEAATTAQADYASAEAALRTLHQRLDDPLSFSLKRRIIEELVVRAQVDLVRAGNRECPRVTVLYRFFHPCGPADRRCSG